MYTVSQYHLGGGELNKFALPGSSLEPKPAFLRMPSSFLKTSDSQIYTFEIPRKIKNTAIWVLLPQILMALVSAVTQASKVLKNFRVILICTHKLRTIVLLSGQAGGSHPHQKGDIKEVCYRSQCVIPKEICWELNPQYLRGWWLSGDNLAKNDVIKVGLNPAWLVFLHNAM